MASVPKNDRFFGPVFVAGTIFVSAYPAMAHPGSHGALDAHSDAAHLVPLIDQFIAFIALGLVLGRLAAVKCVVPYSAHGLGIGLGLLIGLLLVPAEHPVVRALALVLAGFLLLNPGDKLMALPSLTMAVAAFAVGLSYGSALPATATAPLYLGMALAVAVTIGIGAQLLWERLYQPWFLIAGRIIGSWMIAIGIILFGAMLR